MIARDLWVLYGAAVPRRVLDVLSYAECGTTPAGLIPGWTGPNAPYRCTTTRLILASGTETGAPVAWLLYGTRAEADDMLTRPMGAPRVAAPVGQLALELGA